MAGEQRTRDMKKRGNCRQSRCFPLSFSWLVSFFSVTQLNGRVPNTCRIFFVFWNIWILCYLRVVTAEATCTSLPVPDVGTVGISMPFPVHPWLGDTVVAFDMDWLRTSIIHQPSEQNQPSKRERRNNPWPGWGAAVVTLLTFFWEKPAVILKSADTFINRQELFQYQCFQTICIIASLVGFI